MNCSPPLRICERQSRTRIDPLGLADWYIGVDLDRVGIVGFERGVGLVLDTDNLLDSGVWVNGGRAQGANVGIALSGGYACRDIEGKSASIDANVGKVTLAPAFDDKGFNGGSIGSWTWPWDVGLDDTNVDTLAKRRNEMAGRWQMNYQSARLRHLLMLFLAFPAGVILSFALAFRYGEGFLILGFLWALCIELASGRIKCPVCQRPIGFGQYRMFSLRLEWWKAIPAKRCEYERHSAYKPNEEPNNSVFVVKLARVVFGATLVLAGALMMMVDRGEMIACGHVCEAVSTTLISISNGSGLALGSLLILVGVVTWVLPKLRRR